MTNNKSYGVFIQGSKINIWVTSIITGMPTLPFNVIETIKDVEEEEENTLEDLTDEVFSQFKLINPSKAKTVLSFDRNLMKLETLQAWDPMNPKDIPAISDWLKSKGFLKPQR